jgi:VWFA-related protein
MRLRALGQAFGLFVLGLLLLAQTHQERVEVSLVRVDLFVTDSEGHTIRDIKPSEVHLRVDGHDEPIVALEARDAPAAAVAAAAPLPAGSTLGEAMPPNAAPPVVTAPAAAATGDSYAMAVFVDETSSEQFNRTTVYNELSQFVKKGLPPGNLMMLERFDGKLHIECPWTSDSERLQTAISKMESHGFMPRIGQPGRISPAGGAGGTASINTMVYMAVSDALLTSISGLIEAIKTYPANIARRKSLVVVTDGAPFLTAGQLVEEIISSSESVLDRDPGGGTRGGSAKARDRP